MDKSSRFLSLAVAALVLLGFWLIWQGLAAQNPNTQQSVPAPGQEKFEATDSATLGLEGQGALVTKVVDGDTIEVSINEKIYRVRFIGVDTPETVDPRRPVGCFGKEASGETKRLVDGEEIILQKDVSETDKYGRLLRYIYLPLGEGKYLFINDYLIRQGFAKVSTYPPDVKYNEQFIEAQREAVANQRGLWGKCN